MGDFFFFSMGGQAVRSIAGFFLPRKLTASKGYGRTILVSPAQRRPRPQGALWPVAGQSPASGEASFATCPHSAQVSTADCIGVAAASRPPDRHRPFAQKARRQGLRSRREVKLHFPRKRQGGHARLANEARAQACREDYRAGQVGSKLPCFGNASDCRATSKPSAGAKER